MITTEMSGQEIDRVLKAIYEAENTKNNGLILYIRRGEIAFETEENLFDVVNFS